jgi:acyl-CoA thioester hydrolase
MSELSVPRPYVCTLEVKPEWLDPNGHMNVAFYLRAVDDGSNPFFDDIGLGWGYTAEGEGSIFVTGCNMDFHSELFAGDRIHVSTRLVAYAPKLLHCWAEVRRAADDTLASTAETLYMHVSLKSRRSAPMPEAAQQRLAVILDAHARDPLPAGLGRALGIRR